jgi:Uma2 family endonuclease
MVQQRAATTQGSVTWEDFIQLPDDDRRELIDGVLVEVEVPTEIHESIVAKLIMFIGAWARATKAGVVLASGYKVRVSPRKGFMPDIQFFRRDNPTERGHQGLAEGHPDLVVEIISPCSEKYDRVTKLNGYAAIGTPEYWIVHPERRTLDRLVLRDGRYLIAEALEDDAVFKPSAFEGLEIPFAELWNPEA